MVYFKTKIQTTIARSELIKRLNSSLLIETDDFFIFPFCLFQRKFYQYLKLNKDKRFHGKVNANGFHFLKNIHYGNFSSGRTSRNLKIEGTFTLKDGVEIIQVHFINPNYEIIVESILFLVFISVYFIRNDLLFLIIPAIALFDRFQFTLRNLIFLKKIIKPKV